MLNPNITERIAASKLQISWSNLREAWEVHSYKEVCAILEDPRFIVTGGIVNNARVNLPTPQSDSVAGHYEMIQAFQQELPWVREKMTEIVNLYANANRDVKALDFYTNLLLPTCQQLAIQLTCSSIKPEEEEALLRNANSIFRMNHEAQATIDLATYFLEKITLARIVPQTDFTSVLSKTETEPATLVSPLIQLFVGLATSLPLLLSNIVLALATNAAAKERYLHNPSQGVNELLRYAGPAQYVYRMALEDVVIGNQLFRQGERLALFLADANLDEAQFSCPHQLNMERNAIANLSLGKGLHACLGAPLIRAAITIIPAAVFHTFPNLVIDKERIVWGGSDTIKGAVCLMKRED